jgi:PAS domain S-box-containing protein
MKTSIKFKFISLMILIFLVMNATGTVFLIHRMMKNVWQLAEIEYQLEKAISEMEITTNKIAWAVSHYTYNPLERSISEIKNAEQNFEHYANKFRKLAVTEKKLALVEKVIVLYSKFKELGEEIISMAGKPDEKLGEFKNYHIEIDTMLKDMIKPLINKETLRAKKNAMNSGKLVIVFILVAGLFSIALMGVVSWLISKSIIQRRQAEKVHEALLHKMSDRVKELQCLYNMGDSDQTRTTLNEIFQDIAGFIPKSWNYPEITTCRLTFDKAVYVSKPFKKTRWKQSCKITVNNKIRGSIDVYYLEECPELDEGPFLKEERKLLEAIGVRLGHIIERKLSEEAVVKSEQRFRNLIENSPTGIIISRKDKIVYRNSTNKSLAGVSKISSLSDYFKNIHLDDMEKVKQNYQMLISGKKQHIDMAFRFYPARNNVDSLEMKWFHCTASMIYYHGKKATLLNLIDVTITKELDHILRVQDKMISLGRVAAGIAHEIRNPLSGINIYLNTLKKITEQYDNSEKTAKILSQLQSASNKIESVIKRVMDFSRPAETKFSLTDINASIMEAVNLTSVTLRKSGIQFSTALSDNLSKCMADSHMIEQVILNLIANASEAMQNMDKDKKIKISSFLENNNIYIKVKDSGHGIPQDIKNDIFEPFYTTKNNGSGIGLNICHRIITDHGGTLELSSAEQKGAEFIIKIPINGQNR